MNTIINLSNHPSEKWTEAQRDALLAYAAEQGISDAPIRDFPFPSVDPEADSSQVWAMAQDLWNEIDAMDGVLVHCMGETSVLVAFCRQAGKTPVVCSTTAREVVDLPDGRKESRFSFRRIRRIA